MNKLTDAGKDPYYMIAVELDAGQIVALLEALRAAGKQNLLSEDHDDYEYCCLDRIDGAESQLKEALISYMNEEEEI